MPTMYSVTGEVEMAGVLCLLPGCRMVPRCEAWGFITPSTHPERGPLLSDHSQFVRTSRKSAIRELRASVTTDKPGEIIANRYHSESATLSAPKNIGGLGCDF
jgi:hypothetical protein